MASMSEAAASCPVTGTLPDEVAAGSGSCPFAAEGGPVELAPEDELHLPMNKRVIVQYANSPEGVRELHLYCGDKEIVFDEPELFAFGEALARHASFIAGDTLQWAEGYDWPRISELLVQLIEEGVLQRGMPDLASTGTGEGKDQPSPLPPAPSDRPRTWDECEAITREITGHALEEGHLELVVPVFRVAHIALDAEGRQVGEANVFPRPLRVEVPTRWRTCIYPGSRYLDPKPMNVSALKAMRAHWPQIMSALLRIRAAYLKRFPAARGTMTLGDIERLSVAVLALPTYQLVRQQGGTANGELHPVLSNMFRVTDGLRTTTHQMLFLPVAEATLSPDTPVSAAEIHAYAERNYSFHSAQGVCAGPAIMIEQFLRVLIDGEDSGNFANVTLDAPVEAALADMEAVVDYGLLGLQAFAVVFSTWPVMTRTYARMATIARDWPGVRTATLERLDGYLREKAEVLQKETYHATEEWRANRERVYGNMFEQCAAGLGDPVRQPLSQRLAGRLTEEHRAPSETLRGILERRCTTGPGSDAGGVDLLVDTLMHFFVRTQEILCLASSVQERINTLVGRAQPTRLFTARDVDIHILLQGEEARRLPQLVDELERVLGLRVDITRKHVAIAETNEIQA
jgi:hypothetical protein